MMTRVATENGYDFFIQVAKGDVPFLYNIVPHATPRPTGGYPNMAYIEGMKGVKFPGRYRRIVTK